MDKKEIRYTELVHRMAVLAGIKNNVKKELENKALTLMAKAFDGGAEEKLAGSMALLERWIKETEEEAEALQKEVFDAEMQSSFEELEVMLEEERKG